MGNITLTCQECNKSEVFIDEKASFIAGWDIIGIDMKDDRYICTCDKCPSAPILMEITNKINKPPETPKIHETPRKTFTEKAG